MNACMKFFSGCIALSVLACGAKGSDGESDGGGGEDSGGGTSGTGTGGATGGSTTGGSSTGGSATGGVSGSTTGGSGGGGGALPITKTWSFTDAAEVCPVPTAMNMEGCWKFVDSNSDPASTPVPEIGRAH